jgi:hypothetical protein
MKVAFTSDRLKNNRSWCAMTNLVNGLKQVYAGFKLDQSLPGYRVDLNACSEYCVFYGVWQNGGFDA